MDKGKGIDFTYDEEVMEEQSKNLTRRHSRDQINILEGFFKRCPHPTKTQRQQLSNDLGLEPKQIKFWFQNKRSQKKVQKERITNDALRAENEKLRRENFEVKEAFKNITCAACPNTAAQVQNLQRLMYENAWLKNEHERIRRMLFPYVITQDAHTGALSLIPPGGIPFTQMPGNEFAGHGSASQMFGVANQTVANVDQSASLSTGHNTTGVTKFM